ncbi:MAG: peptidoglycan-binding protein [Candidatus Omnitrophica bacterium]|nr:peptidoglycan-binding protein [Candidatus Omnitrophota bacterium]MCM8793220.1 peptidoglycan-binding protein [Candidatus Omnitrophota bacterium]
MGRFIFLILIMVFFTFGCATPSRQMDLEMQKLRTQIGTLEEQLKESEKEIEDLEIQLEREKELRKKLEKQLLTKKEEFEKNQSLPKPTIRNIQSALKRAGFYTGEIDGKLGPKTREAIKKFQRDKGLKVDGIVGKTTWRELFPYLTEK